MSNRNYLTSNIREMAKNAAPIQENPGYLAPDTRVYHPEDGMGTVIHTSLTRKVLVQLDEGGVQYYPQGAVQLVLPGVE